MRCGRFAKFTLLIGIALAVGASVGGAGAARPVSHVAGYAVTPNPALPASASTALSVPTITSCPDPNAFQAVLAGARLDVPGGNTGAGVVLVCNGTTSVYLSDVQINGTSTLGTYTAAPGDHVTASASESSTGASGTVTDTTAGWTQTITGSGGSATGAEVGYSAGNCGGGASCSPVPAVSGTTFSGSMLDGSPLSAGTSAVASDLTAANGSVQIAVGNANRKTGNFPTTFRRSCHAAVAFGTC